MNFVLNIQLHIVIGICATNIIDNCFCALDLMWSMMCYVNDYSRAMFNCGLGLMDRRN
jgi:hypothetical protein